MGDSLEGADANQGEEEHSVAVLEFPVFANYIRKVVTVHLEDDDIIPGSLNAALEDRSNQDCIKKFISDPQVSSLLIERSLSKGKKFRFHLVLEM